MNRREFFTTTGVALTVGCSGCVTDEFPPSDRSPSAVTASPESIAVRTPPPGDCAPATEARPSPDSSGTQDYPSLPDAPTHADSRSFATAFERAYQINLRIPGYRNIQVELTAPAWATTAMRGGYTVGLDARIQFGNPTTPTPPAETPATPTATPKPRPSGFFEYTVYFLVTKRFTIRGEPLDGDHERGDTPKFPDARTVACNGGEA